MRQHHDCRAIDGGVVAFARPRTHLRTIRWITKYDFGAPILMETVLPLCKKPRALRLSGRSAHVECELKFLVQEAEEVGWR
jgi:hypothetical protein